MYRALPGDDLEDRPDLSLHGGRELRGAGGEEVGDVPGDGPLAQVQQEQVLPALLQQQHLRRGQSDSARGGE